MVMVKLGHGQSVRRDLIESILRPDGSSMKNLRQEYKERGRLINATFGRKTLSMILTTTGRLYLTAFQSETLEARVNNSKVHNKDNDF
ncbi:MAG: DUF370 domain-containing protein [Thermodesulfobacteriota bacterium]|jgi:regulator of extracellular matrix RemA (YlzA/DUF370 family)